MTLTRRQFLSLAASCMAGSFGCSAHAFTENDRNAPRWRNEMPLTPAETLMHTTVRLECTLSNGSISTGTGFFFSFKVDGTAHVPVIITNKHVINNSKVGAFVLTKSNEQGEPIRGSTERVVLDNFENLWVKHPEKNVDLAAFPIAPLYHQAETKGIKFFAPPIGEDLLPSEAKLADLSGLENITMIGYPNGIWDEKNNLPIVRRGITATNPKYDYNGLPLFVIDCACFPGSSGSPVLLFDCKRARKIRKFCK